MQLPPFKIERYFAQYEFSAPFLLSCSDCEPLSQKELLALADDQTRELWDTLWLGYTESQGHPLLRQEITNLYQSIKQDDVLVLVPVEGIFISMNCMLTKGDHMIVTYPGYQSLYQVAESIGCEVSNWVAQETETSWVFEVDQLAKLIQKNTKALVINFPHNPTGALLSQSQLHDVVELARKHDLYIFSDEMYRGLELNEQERLPSVAEIYEKAVSLSGVSKTLGLPGLRIGWLTTKNPALYKKLATFKDYTTICNSAPSEILALIGLRARDVLLKHNCTTIQENSKICQEFFSRYPDLFKYIAPQASSCAFARYLPKQGVDAFAKQLIDSKGLMILPSSVFDFGNHHFRLGLGRKNVPEVLAVLDQFLQEL